MNNKQQDVWDKFKLFFEIGVLALLSVLGFFLNRSYTQLDETVKELKNVVIQINSQGHDIQEHQTRIEKIEKKDEVQDSELKDHNNRLIIIEGEVFNNYNKKGKK